MTVTRCVCE